MAIIRSFRDLNVYKSTRTEALKIFEISKKFPRDEKFSMTDQIRRSSRAVKSMIAEAWARRRYEAAFINKINEAMGEAAETQSWLDDALDCGYITNEQHSSLDSSWQSIGGMLNNMIERSNTFCSTKVR